MQAPIFKQIDTEVDLKNCFLGTLNVNIAPKAWEMIKPWKSFESVKWYIYHEPEDFYFLNCNILFQKEIFQGYIYYPSPKTKKIHFHNVSTMEIIAPKIKNISYGDAVVIHVSSEEIRVHEN
jgi:CTP-dependent riboflavin kinase